MSDAALFGIVLLLYIVLCWYVAIIAFKVGEGKISILTGGIFLTAPFLFLTLYLLAVCT